MKYFLVDIDSGSLVRAYGIYQDAFEDWAKLTKNQDKVSYVICSESEIVSLAKEKHKKEFSHY